MKKILVTLLLAAFILSGISALASGLQISLPSALLEKSAAPGKVIYEVLVVDQNGDPVPECSVGFCLNTGCVPVECDENGRGSFEAAPDAYHVKVIDAPEGYDYPDDTDTYIGPDSGSVTLTITKE